MRFPWKRVKQVSVGVPIVVPLVVLSGFVVRGCSTAHVPNVHPPPGVTLPPEPATSAPQDLTGVQLAAVDGTTTVPGVANAGTSHLSGGVSGPQGPVAAANVHIEHLVGNRSFPFDLVTDAAGRWDLPNIAGGRYRVRAYLPPTLAQAEPQVFFLNEGDQREVDVTLDTFNGAPEVQIAIAPDPPNLGEPASLVARVTRRTVSSDGVVRAAPIAGASVTFNATDSWTVTGPATAGTNESGDATFVVSCRKAGTNIVQVTLRVPGVAPQAVSQQVSACVDARATTTTTTTPGTPPSTTTTTTPVPN